MKSGSHKGFYETVSIYTSKHLVLSYETDIITLHVLFHITREIVCLIIR